MTDRPRGESPEADDRPDRMSYEGTPYEGAEEVTAPPADPVREAKERDVEDPADADVSAEEWRQGGPTRTPGARTTTGGSAGPAMRPGPGRRNPGATAPTTPGDATSGGMDRPTSGTTSDASGEVLPGEEEER